MVLAVDKAEYIYQ